MKHVNLSNLLPSESVFDSVEKAFSFEGTSIKLVPATEFLDCLNAADREEITRILWSIIKPEEVNEISINILG